MQWNPFKPDEAMDIDSCMPDLFQS